MSRITFCYLFILSLLVPNTACSQNTNNYPSQIELDTKIGQMLMVGFRGLSINESSPIVDDIEKYGLGGVVLFDYDVPADTSVRNIESPEQLAALVNSLQSHANIPLFVSIDQEGGKVARLKPKFGFPETVSAQYLGRINNVDTTRKYAREMGQTLSKMNINMNLAPVVDLNTNPDNPVIGGLERSFSADPDIVSRHARIFIESLHEYGIITSLKHFPGHGSSEDDSHLGVVDVTQSWRQTELEPYKRLIESGTADAVMTAHIYNARLDSVYPATLSEPTISGILRDSLGFEGVILSDDLQMGAIREQYTLKETIRQSLEAGVDILVFANNSVFDPEIAEKAHRIVKELVRDGVVSPERIDRSYRRIMQLKKEYLMSDG